MNELKFRLFSRPLVAAELLLASLLASVLGLASTFFVILVLNRYVAHGVDATLATLAVGVTMAVLFEFAFRQARFRIAQGLGRDKDENLLVGAFAVLTGARSQAIEAMAPGPRREAVAGAEVVQAAYAPANLCAVLDVPMALVFIGVLFLFDWALALIVCLFAAAVVGLSFLLHGALKNSIKETATATARRGGLIAAAIASGDTLRAFNGKDYLRRLWKGELDIMNGIRRRLVARQNLTQTGVQLVQGLMGVAIIAF